MGHSLLKNFSLLTRFLETMNRPGMVFAQLFQATNFLGLNDFRPTTTETTKSNSKPRTV